MNKFELKNKISVVFEQAKNSQKVALCLNLSISEEEKLQPTYNLMSRLLLKGINLDKNIIELHCKKERDFLSFQLTCANQDLALALETLAEVIENPPFKGLSSIDFDVEKSRIREEILSELDLPKVEVFDNYYKALFEGHFYSNTQSETIENLDKIAKEDVEKAYGQVVLMGKKVIAVVADLPVEDVEALLNKHFGTFKNEAVQELNSASPCLKESKSLEKIKSGIEKSQVVFGWIFPTFDSDDYAAISVLNIILGHEGLCSRLFLELRGEQDLVYAIRSSYDTYKQSASLSIYIATSAENIEKALEEATKVIQLLKQDGVDDVELNYAKKVLLSRAKKSEENITELASQLAFYYTMVLGPDFQEKFMEKVKKITSEQVQLCANEYFRGKPVVSILRSGIK